MKGWLGQTFAADVVDMESYCVSESAEEWGIPHLILRAVFDPVEQTLPEFVTRSLGSSTARIVLRAASYSMTHPGTIGTTLALKAQARRATTSLSQFLVKLTPDSARLLNLAASAG